MCNLVDPIDVIIDLIRLQLSQNTRPSHLSPDQIQHLRSLAAPAMLLAQLLRIVPAAALNDRSNDHVIVARRLDIEFVSLSNLLYFVFLLRA